MAVREVGLAFFDTETTGFVPGKDQIIEVATVITDFQFNEISRFEAKIKPTVPVPKAAADINGYNEADWKDAQPDLSEWKNWLSQHAKQWEVLNPVGHNIGYDIGMSRPYYKPSEWFPFSYHAIDTVVIAGLFKMAGILNIPNLKLNTVMKALDMGAQEHRAMADVEATIKITKMAAKMFKEYVNLPVKS